ncbi:MAG: RagB/SusD family nutrient uptake outer membrane protein [Bacteroidales bacterium]|jgi:hypothetical protein|nr:RagB/SusD family nutrient uptake outer membrane protein [Bacteroidales bacterium]
MQNYPGQVYGPIGRLLFRKGKYRNNEVSITGGSDKIKYFSSFGYTEQEGVSIMSYMKRLSGRLNLSYDVSKRLSAGMNTLFSNVKQSTNTEGTTYVGPFYSVFNTVPPRDVPFLEDGRYAFNFPRNGQGRNPKAYADLNYQHENIIRAYNTIYAGYRIIEGLEFKSTLNYDFNMIKGEQFTHPLSAYPLSLGSISKSFNDIRATVWTNSSQYLKTFAKVHNLDALIAYEISDYSVDNIDASKTNLANWDMVELDNFSAPGSIGGLHEGYRMLSIISRVNIVYLDPIVHRANPSNTITGTVTLAQVIKERRKELVGEDHRQFDALRNNETIVRIGGWHIPNLIDGVKSSNKDYFHSMLPVPKYEMDANINMKQNPGYSL